MRAYYRGYQRAGAARVHVMRETAKKAYRSTWHRPGPESWCGTTAYPTTNSPVVDVDTTKPLADGLVWCWKCVAGAAEHAGLIEQIVDLVIAATTTKES